MSTHPGNKWMFYISKWWKENHITFMVETFSFRSSIYLWSFGQFSTQKTNVRKINRIVVRDRCALEFNTIIIKWHKKIDCTLKPHIWTEHRRTLTQCGHHMCLSSVWSMLSIWKSNGKYRWIQSPHETIWVVRFSSSLKWVWFVGFVVEVYFYSFELDVNVDILVSPMRRRNGKFVAPLFLWIRNENFPLFKARTHFWHEPVDN